MSETSFTELIARIRAGDQQAAAELVRLYEPVIRRAIRFRLTDTRLRGALDSMDICQSVLASFFVRAASGQYQLEEEADLQKLLTAMARNKLKMLVRGQCAQRRDRRRVQGGVEALDLAAAEPTASRQLAARELLEAAHQRLAPEERALVECRNQGLTWDEIARQLGGSPDALRVKLARALDRVAVELGLEENEPQND
jgi:RNA polymerase sigma-70 factor (ECF subfamily)